MPGPYQRQAISSQLPEALELEVSDLPRQWRYSHSLSVTTQSFNRNTKQTKAILLLYVAPWSDSSSRSHYNEYFSVHTAAAFMYHLLYSRIFLNYSRQFMPPLYSQFFSIFRLNDRFPRVQGMTVNKLCLNMTSNNVHDDLKLILLGYSTALIIPWSVTVK